jgi:methionyl-tRNA formyltransferase
MARLAYLGSPELSVPPLRALLEAGHHIELVSSSGCQRPRIWPTSSRRRAASLSSWAWSSPSAG